jgi:taurine dioxygenase
VEQLSDIRDAFNAYHVLVFRDQVLTPEEHKRFGRLFGTLDCKSPLPLLRHRLSGAAPTTL